MANDRRDDTSQALNEIRAARERSVAAMKALDGDLETRRTPAQMVGRTYVPIKTEAYRDPDSDDMQAALADFIAATERWS